MRLMRLRQALEAEAGKEGFRERDRKRRLNPFKAKDKMYALQDGEDDDDETLDDMPLMQRHYSRMMRIKREEGLLIKNEDGTVIKGEDGAMVKNEDDGFWGKKEDLDEQEETLVKTEQNDNGINSFFEGDHLDWQSHAPPIARPEDGIKSENVGYASSSVQQPASRPRAQPGYDNVLSKTGAISSLATPQQQALYSNSVKMELDPALDRFCYPGNSHSPAALRNAGTVDFRTYSHANTSSPFSHHYGGTIDNAEPTVSHGHDAALLGYNNNNNPASQFAAFNQFAQERSNAAVKSETNNKRDNPYDGAPPPPPHTLNSPFRLDMFNAALSTTSLNARGQVNTAVDSVNSSPRVKDHVSENASDRGYPSPTPHQSHGHGNFR
jgi:hypothetical protein